MHTALACRSLAPPRWIQPARKSSPTPPSFPPPRRPFPAGASSGSCAKAARAMHKLSNQRPLSKRSMGRTAHTLSATPSHNNRYSQSKQCDVGMHACFGRSPLLCYSRHQRHRRSGRNESSYPSSSCHALPAPPALHGPSDRHPPCPHVHVPQNSFRISHVAPPRQAASVFPQSPETRP